MCLIQFTEPHTALKIIFQKVISTINSSNCNVPIALGSTLVLRSIWRNLPLKKKQKKNYTPQEVLDQILGRKCPKYDLKIKISKK